ncbi:MAG: DUF4350 domain-containing protein [bacterium]|nr:DUF4350 domain-containing protein [bacterium]
MKPQAGRASVLLLALVGDLLVCLALLIASGLAPPLLAGPGALLAALSYALGLPLLCSAQPSSRLSWRLLLLLPLPLLAVAAPLPAGSALLWLGLVLLRCWGKTERLRLLSRLALLGTVASILIALPPTWWLFEWMAQAQSALLAWLAGRPLRLGEGPLLHLPLFFLLRGAAAWRGDGSPRRLTGALAGFLLQTLVVSQGWRLGWLDAQALQTWLPLGLFPLYFLMDESAARMGSPAAGAGGRPLHRWSPLPPLLAALLLALCLAPPPARLDGLEVGLRREGLWSGERPIGEDGASPRLGGFIAVLEAWGARVGVHDDETLRQGPPGRVLFLVQPDQPLDDELRRSLRAWMEGGGVLVAVGEHTHVHGIGEGLGSLLADYHIRLRDDCAIPSLNGWLWSHNLRFLHAPATTGLRDSQHLGVSIGASLELAWPAQPLVTGSLAFADAGKADNPRGRMGNTRPDAGERLGAVPLIAAEQVGRGLLVVLGDKSPLMSLNNPLVWPFYLNLAGRQAERQPWRDNPFLLGGLALLLAGGLLPFLRAAPSRREALVATLLAAALWWPLRLPGLPPPAPGTRGDLVWIDSSHQPNWIHPPDHDWSARALVEASHRSGALPLNLPLLDEELLAGGRALLLAGPARAWSKREIALLRRYVEKGGRLVVAADGRRRAPLGELLAEFGLALDEVPLGAAPEVVDGAGRPLGFTFWEAWPLLDLAGGADTLASCWGLPLALKRGVGEGQVIVVGDERLFSRWSLEGPSRSGTWRSTASRFRNQAPLLPRIQPTPEKIRFLQSLAPGATTTPAIAAGPPRGAPAATAGLDEPGLRRRWALALLGCVEDQRPPLTRREPGGAP